MNNALISVSDKSKLISFAKYLAQNKWHIYATGQTFKMLESHDIKALKVEDLTMFPEMMEGRVKTLHPNIHGAILGKRDNTTHQAQAHQHNIPWIDLVVVNLYPFKKTMLDKNATDEEVIEQIDIGGPALIRSAAKNHPFVSVVVDPEDYEDVIKEMDTDERLSLATRRRLAAKAFRHTAQYDAQIAAYFTTEPFPEKLTISYDLSTILRYGENPHQTAALYQDSLSLFQGIFNLELIHGKQLSYNNIQDMNAAIRIINGFEKPTAVVLKHTNPCGVASASSIQDAFEKAYASDPISIFGGIVAVNQEIDDVLANRLHQLFLEVVIAPSYQASAQDILTKKRNIRLIKHHASFETPSLEIHSVEGGVLIQEQDFKQSHEIHMPTICKPTQLDLDELLFCLKVVKHVKSNAIVVAKNEMTLGVGAGQMNRVGAAKIALKAAGSDAQGAYLASDGFLPMTDTITLAAKSGIKAIIQPGGSIKDQACIDMCDEHGIIMVLTGMRHFKH